MHLPGEWRFPRRTLQVLVAAVRTTGRSIPVCALWVYRSQLQPPLRFVADPIWSRGDFSLAFSPGKAARVDRGYLHAIRIVADQSVCLSHLSAELRRPRIRLPLRESSEFSAVLGLSREAHCPAASRFEEALLSRFLAGQQGESVKLPHKGVGWYECSPVLLAPPVWTVGVWAPLGSPS